MTKPGALLVAVIVWAATLIACSSKSAEPTSQPVPPVLAPGESTLTKNLPVELHVTCP